MAWRSYFNGLVNICVLTPVFVTSHFVIICICWILSVPLKKVPENLVLRFFFDIYALGDKLVPKSLRHNPILGIYY